MSDFATIDDLLPKKQSQPTDDDFQVDESQTVTGKFSDRMDEIGIKFKEREVMIVASQLGLPHIDLTSFPVSSEALKVIAENEAQASKIVCFYYMPGELRLGCVNYSEEVDELAFHLGEKFHSNTAIYLISENSLANVLKLYKNLPVVIPISKDINITDADIKSYQEKVKDYRDLSKHFENVSITDILTLMIAAALKVEASDVHVEAEEQGIIVRYRIDGVLQAVAKLPKEQWKKFISRIKLLAELKINITDRPQDGRVSLKLDKSSLDIRVSTMPTVFGESVVMRILYSGNKQVTFDELGLSDYAYEDLKREISRPNGMIVTTGPTGSGKTTTMYAILDLLNKPGVKIITLEDPVEIKMEGINQSQVDPQEGYTFAAGLRSLLRQDPDICMVGEIRDFDTAEIAIQASLTGHLMLSTIHTNDASGAIPRFLAMGVKPYYLAPALNSVIGQRLVRKICTKCVQPVTITAKQQELVNQHIEKLPDKLKEKIDLNNLQFFAGKGCEHCSGLGYKGRIGIYEIFTKNKEIERAILDQRISEYEIKELAMENGMVTMVQDGIIKALNKVTSIEEIFRVTE